jgi:SSS family solute:Na+ symporter
MATLIVGFVLGAIRLVLELMNGAGQDQLASPLLSAVAEFNFLHFAVVLFVISVAILIGVSLVTGDPPHDKVAGLTFETADEPVARETGHRGDDDTTGEATVATKERVDTEEEVLDLDEASEERRYDAWLSVGVVVLVALVWILFA